jgi:tetratricopeptide (TPR) repeat protein
MNNILARVWCVYMLKEIRNWKRKEGSIRESLWLAEGIRLYRKLVRKHPESTEYKKELAKLLVKSGEDEKLKYVNLMNAKELFDEVLTLFPDDADALYRLGHIYYEIKEYEKCIEYFSKAIHQPLSVVRKFRSFLTMSKAYFHLKDDGEAYRHLEEAKKIDIENNFSSEIKEAEALITQKGYYHRMVRYPDGVYQLISIDVAEELRSDYEGEECTLDLSHFRPTFSGSKDIVYLERKEAEILKCLIEKNEFLKTDKLIEYVWHEDGAPLKGTIRYYISTINSKLKKCLPEEWPRAIINERGKGYKLNSVIETKILMNP